MSRIHSEIPLKTQLEIRQMKRPAAALAGLFEDASALFVPGASTRLLEDYWKKRLPKLGAKTLLNGYNGFPASISTSVNDVAVHGIPDEYRLKEGDLVTVDVMIEKNGWASDAAWTYSVGKPGPEGKALREAAWRCCLAGVAAVRSGSSIQEIAGAVELVAQRLGCTICGSFCGHGIGRSVHEEPIVPHVVEYGSFITVVPGMVLNIEPVVTFGTGETSIDPDGWSHRTVDGRMTAQFEHTVAVSWDGIEILTLTPGSLRAVLRQSPF